MNFPPRAQFLAQVEVFPLGPQTRQRPAYNGIRWSFAYAEDVEAGGIEQADIWPEFVDACGVTLTEDVPLAGVLNARMHMVTVDWSHSYVSRIVTGARFFVMEGPRPVASGVVTEVFRNEGMSA